MENTQLTEEQLKALMDMGLMEERQSMPVMGNQGSRNDWQQNLGVIDDMYTKRPVSSPIAGGTQTENRRQYNETLAFQKERAAADDAFRQQQLRAARSGGSQPKPDGRAAASQSLQAVVSDAIKNGLGWSHVKRLIEQNAGAFSKDTIPFEEAMQLAQTMYTSNAYDDAGKYIQQYAPSSHPNSMLYGQSAGPFVPAQAMNSTPLWQPNEDPFAIYQYNNQAAYNEGFTDPFYTSGGGQQPQSNNNGSWYSWDNMVNGWNKLFK